MEYTESERTLFREIGEIIARLMLGPDDGPDPLGVLADQSKEEIDGSPGNERGEHDE
jgi:hypothetical protein